MSRVTYLKLTSRPFVFKLNAERDSRGNTGEGSLERGVLLNSFTKLFTTDFVCYILSTLLRLLILFGFSSYFI
jgi:hypothetical protein